MAYRSGAIVLSGVIPGLVMFTFRCLWASIRFAFVASGGTASSFAFFVLTGSAAILGAIYGTLWLNPLAPLWQVGLVAFGLWWCLVVGSDVIRLMVSGRPISGGGSARWAKVHEYIVKRYRPGSIFLGRTCRSVTGVSFELGHKCDRHALCIAGSRGGKGASFLIPNIIRHPGSMLALDPKGELSSICANHRQGDVVILDPMNETDGHPLRGSWNPLDAIDCDAADVAEQIGVVVDALVIEESGDAAHWAESASTLLSGLIAHVLITETGPSRSLATVRDLLTQAEDSLNVTLEFMASHNGPPTLARLAREASSLMSCDSRQRSGFITTTARATAFLASAPMRDQVSTSTFDIRQLKGGLLSLFVVLPERHLKLHNRWMRLIVAQTIAEASAQKTKPQHPLTLFLDEMAVLGYMRSLEVLMGIGAGAGIRVVPVIQSVGQLKRHYRDWSVFIANSGVVWVGPISDLETATLISKHLGSRMRAGWERRDKGGLDQAVSLADPTELMQFLRRERMTGIALVQGWPALKIKRRPYFKDHVAIRDYDQPQEFREGSDLESQGAAHATA